jgi:hypothetical protein
VKRRTNRALALASLLRPGLGRWHPDRGGKGGSGREAGPALEQRATADQAERGERADFSRTGYQRLQDDGSRERAEIVFCTVGSDRRAGNS